MVGLAAVVIIVRIAHQIAARRIVAVDEDGVVVVDEALQLSVDPVVAIAWLLPPERLVRHDHIPSEQFLAQFFHRSAAEICANFCAVAIAVAVFSEGGGIDCCAQGIVNNIRRADKSPLRIGGGNGRLLRKVVTWTSCA